MSSYTVEVEGKYLLTCWCRKARGLMKRLMMQVIFQLEYLFRRRHIYNTAGCSGGTFQCMPHSREGSNTITHWRQWAEWSRIWSQSFLGTGSNSILSDYFIQFSFLVSEWDCLVLCLRLSEHEWAQALAHSNCLFPCLVFIHHLIFSTSVPHWLSYLILWGKQHRY